MGFHHQKYIAFFVVFIAEPSCIRWVYFLSWRNLYFYFLCLALLLCYFPTKPNLSNNLSILTFLYPDDISETLLYLSGLSLSCLQPSCLLRFSLVFLVILFYLPAVFGVWSWDPMSSSFLICSGPSCCWVYLRCSLSLVQHPLLRPISPPLWQLLYVPVWSFACKLGIRTRHAHYRCNIFLAVEYRSDNDSEWNNHLSLQIAPKLLSGAGPMSKLPNLNLL